MAAIAKNQDGVRALEKILRYDQPSLDEALQNARILVADDEVANRLLLRRMLGKCGAITGITATNGREAVEMCQGGVPDLDLLDDARADGYGVWKTLLCRVENILPVLALTADVNPATMRRALGAGAYRF